MSTTSAPETGPVWSPLGPVDLLAVQGGTSLSFFSHPDPMRWFAMPWCALLW